MSAKGFCLILLNTLLVGSFSIVNAADFRDFTAPIDARVSDLISKLTTTEKLIMRTRDNPAISRLGIGEYHWWDEMEMGWTTIWPSGLGKSCSWDRDLIHKIGVVMGDEARADFKTGKTFYSPSDANIAVDPRAGRNDETWGEDPYLSGELTVLLTRGAQGNNEYKMRGGSDYYIKVGVIAKHLVGNNHENNRFHDTSYMDMRDFREYYMPPFEVLVKKADVAGIMTGLNKVTVIEDPEQQGLWNYENPKLLNNILRQEWNFKGYVTTDCASNRDGPTTVRAGVDQLCPTASECINTYRTHEIDSTRMPMDLVNQAVSRGLRIRFRGGEFDPDSVCPYRKITKSVQNTPASQELARRAAREAIVLLKNTNSMLPLDKKVIKKIALVGVVSEHPANASGEDRYFGGYCRQPQWSTVVTLKTALQNVANANGITLSYAKGLACVNSTSFSFSATEISAIQGADVVICAVGCKSGGGLDIYQPCQGDHRFPKEGEDMIDIQLPGVQEAMMSQVYKYNHKTVVVLQDLAVRDSRCAFDTCPAVISSLGAGQAMGTGMVDVLFGDFNPSGKTTQTWVRGIENYPQLHRPQAAGEQKWPIEPVMKREYRIRGQNGTKPRTYWYYNGPVNFPFGFGLSYTTFEYSNLVVTATTNSSGISATVAFSVANTGQRDGAEVAQVYVHALNTSPLRPLKSLQNFYRAEISKGATVNISNLALGPRAFAYWREDKKKFWIDAGRYEIMVGSSSRDIKLRDTITLPEGDGSSFDPIDGGTPLLPNVIQQKITGRPSTLRVFVGSGNVHFNGLPDKEYIIFTCNGRMLSQVTGSHINRYLSHMPTGMYLAIQKKSKFVGN